MAGMPLDPVQAMRRHHARKPYRNEISRMPGTLLQLILFTLAAQAEQAGDHDLAAAILDFEARGEHHIVEFVSPAQERLSVSQWIASTTEQGGCSFTARYFPSRPLRTHLNTVRPTYMTDHSLQGDTDMLGRPRLDNDNPAPWAIAVTFPDSIRYWWPDWQANHPRPTSGPVWTVSYRELPVADPGVDWPPLPVARENLKRALNDILEVDQSEQSGHWSNAFFLPALRLLDPASASEPFPVLPENLGLSPDREQLLRGALRGWVFGGMGSWNDNGPSSPEIAERWEAVTQALYTTTSYALVAAVNDEQPTSCPAP